MDEFSMPETDRLGHAADLVEEARRWRVEAAQQSSAARRAHAEATRGRRLVQDRRAAVPAPAHDQRPGLLLFQAGFARVDDPERIVAALLDAALALLRAPMGDVQLVDEETGGLRIAAQRGFDRAFLDHFAVVDDQGTTCGVALAEARAVRVRDVERDGPFAPVARRQVLAAGVRSVQSVPLLGRDGARLGVLSVHHRTVRDPAPTETTMLATLAAAGARRLDRRAV